MQQALIQTTGAGAADARRTGVVCLFSGGGSAGARFLFMPCRGPRQRLWRYAGSGRLTPSTIERYTVDITAADRYLVLMTNEAWEHLAEPAIKRICLGARTPEDASAALVKAACAHGRGTDAAAAVVRLS